MFPKTSCSKLRNFHVVRRIGGYTFIERIGVPMSLLPRERAIV
jgi:hypothetical protein